MGVLSLLITLCIMGVLGLVVIVSVIHWAQVIVWCFVVGIVCVISGIPISALLVKHYDNDNWAIIAHILIGLGLCLMAVGLVNVP
jgi:hypothetical protein